MTTTVHLEVRGAMRDLFRTADSVVISGPSGTGKTYQTLAWLHLMLLKHPGTKALVVRKVARTLTGTTLATFREKVASEALNAGLVHYYGGSGQEPASFRYTNGSRIVLGGLDEPTKIMGSEVSIVLIDEAIETTARDIDMLRTRLRGAVSSYGDYRMVLLTNPGPPTHHLKTRTDLRMAYSVHEDNPELFSGGQWTAEGRRYLESLEKLSGPRYHRLRHGRWAAAEGVVYDGFDPAVHVIDSFDIPGDWPRTLAVDFGFVHPFAAMWLARDGDGRLYVYRELLMTGRLVEDHAAQMLRIRQPDEPWPRDLVCDHQAEDRATLERHLGAGTQPAKKTVSDGIQAVASRLKPAGDGRPRLFFMRDSLIERDAALADEGKPACLTEEFGSYVWNDHKAKDEPVKENDDLMDCLRYAVAEHDLQPRPRVRIM